MIFWRWECCVETFALQPIFLGCELQAWMKKTTWLSTRQHFLLGEFYGGQVSWTTSNPRTLKAGLRITPTWGNFSFPCFSTLYTIPTFASDYVVLGWNSWPTGALLHKSRASNRGPLFTSQVRKEILNDLWGRLLRDGAPT